MGPRPRSEQENSLRSSFSIPQSSSSKKAHSRSPKKEAPSKQQARRELLSLYPNDPEDHLIFVGSLGRPHGLSGKLKLTPKTDFPERFTPTAQFIAQEPDRPTRYLIELKTVIHQGSHFIVEIENCSTLEQAEALKGLELFITPEQLPELPEGEYWHFELEGLSAFDEEQQPIGILEEVLESPAHDIYLIRTPSGEEILIPAVSAWVQEIRLTEGAIFVTVPKL